MIETPNAESMAMSRRRDFWRDPTHIAPRHPAALTVLAREHGFEIDEIRAVHELPEGARIAVHRERRAGAAARDSRGKRSPVRAAGSAADPAESVTCDGVTSITACDGRQRRFVLRQERAEEQAGDEAAEVRGVVDLRDAASR